MTGETANPLQWPSGQPRSKRRENSQFGLSLKDARDHLTDELRRMGARYVVISSDMELRRDGLPYANQKQPIDKGVAVYFQWQGKQMTFACDRWNKVEDNIRAIGKTIEAIRGIARWGASDMMERAFSAFEALPSPDQAITLTCWHILGIEQTSNKDEIERAFRRQAKVAHPDQGGSREEWDALVNAANEARKL